MGMLKFTIRDNFTEAMAKKLAATSTKAEQAVAVQVQKDTEPFVPASGAPAGLSERTQVLGNQVVYPGPYARYLYYGKVMVDSVTGKGPMRFFDKKGNEQIKFRKGATLKPTDRDLKIDQSVHGQAQAHWFEASKSQNLDKWERVVAKAVENDL